MDRDLRNVASSSRAIKKKKRKECTQMFPVPSNLVESYQGVLSPKLTFRCGEYDKKWRIKVEKFNGQYFFTDGWKEFEEEVGLKSREFLMYRNASSKRRALLGKNKEKRRKISGNTQGKENTSLGQNNGSGVEKKLSFLKKLKMHHKFSLESNSSSVIPNDFARRAGILKRGEVKLKNSEGREWPVHVIITKSDDVHLGSGWLYFLNDNNIIVGSTLSFSLSSSDTIDVQVVKEGTDKEALFGRPKIRSGEQMLSFRKEIKKYHQYRMDLPKNFVMTNGLERAQINLKNSEGREWPLQVKSKKNRRTDVFYLTEGWFDFLKGNNVALGSTLSFSLISSDTIVVKIVKEGSDKRALFKYQKLVRVRDASDHANVPTSSSMNARGGNEDRLSASEAEMDLESEEE